MDDNIVSFFTRSFGTLKIVVGFANETARKTNTADLQALSLMKLSKTSDVFVGGIPAGKSLPAGIESKTYVGCIDRLSIDKTVTGLWNWKVCVVDEICVSLLVDQPDKVLTGSS